MVCYWVQRCICRECLGTEVIGDADTDVRNLTSVMATALLNKVTRRHTCPHAVAHVSHSALLRQYICIYVYIYVYIYGHIYGHMDIHIYASLCLQHTQPLIDIHQSTATPPGRHVGYHACAEPLACSIWARNITVKKERRCRIFRGMDREGRYRIVGEWIGRGGGGHAINMLTRDAYIPRTQRPTRRV